MLSAARVVARELRRAGPPVGRLDAVPQKGLAGGVRRGRALGALVRYGLWAAVVSSVAAFFLTAPGAGDVLGTWQPVLQVAIGVVLAGEGLLLVSNWHGARWRLVQRQAARQEAKSRQATGLFDALRWRLFGYALFALGLVWVGVGVIELGQGAADLL